MPEQHTIYQEYPPSAPLKPYVDCFWSRVSPPGNPKLPHRVLPDGCIDIIFNFGDSWVRRDDSGSQPRERSAVVGTMRRPLVVEPGQREEFLGVRFRPGKARAFLQVPAGALTDRAVPLQEVWGREGSELKERLLDLPKLPQRLDVLERTLVRRLARGVEDNASLDAMVELILRRGGMISVRTLSDAGGFTRQHLARTFEQHVGVPPKLFCRVIRFQHLIRRMAGKQPHDWAGLAAELGYYDQAHMISDFRQFAGLTPTRYRAGLL